MTENEHEKLKAAFQLHEMGRLKDAASLYQEILAANPNNLDALHFLGTIHASCGNLDEARRLIERSLCAHTPNISFLENYATILFQMGDCKTALEVCDRGRKINNKSINLLYVSAVSLYKLGRLRDSLRDFDALLSVEPNHIAAINERGSVLAELNQYDAAISAVEKALALNPSYAEAILNRGNIYGKLKRHDEALAAFDKVLTLKSDSAEAWLGRGNVCRELRRHDEALAAYDKALALRPDLDSAWVGRGHVYLGLRRHDEALAAYDGALALKSDSAEALLGLGIVHTELGRHDEALNAYRKLFAIDPDCDFVKGYLLHAKMLCCDWGGLAELYESIKADMRGGGNAAEPFGFQAISNSEEELLVCAQTFAAEKFPPPNIRLSGAKHASRSKIRIGYLAGEFRQQATSVLMTQLFELHDKARFEIVAFDNGWDDGSELRARMNEAFDEIIPIARIDDLKAATAVKDKEIDILVNLNGYFGLGRQGVFAYKPSPIQVNYLGFPGTLGVDYMDYLIADRTVIPETSRQYYSEKIAYLPNSYQANDRKRRISDRNFTREELGLPGSGFVFCCFNKNYKIAPATFDGWMRILKKVEGSILWLIADTSAAADNLRREAAARGVGAERLVFAPRMPLADHLARHRLADLFLDTLPYNAHTTGSDALWAGLPILTCVGPTFPGRVGASLLGATGLPELVVHAQDDYEAAAVELATDRAQLGNIRQKLADSRMTAPLFDTPLFTKHIEAAYTAFYERYRAGLPPDHVYVSP
jgi:predicted O-linked N-acetylglucosamine transferase (SPINDLY family)